MTSETEVAERPGKMVRAGWKEFKPRNGGMPGPVNCIRLFGPAHFYRPLFRPCAQLQNDHARVKMPQTIMPAPKPTMEGPPELSLIIWPGPVLTGSAIVAAIPPANNPTPKAVATTPKTRAAIWTQVVLVALRSDGEWFGVAWFSICAGMEHCESGYGQSRQGIIELPGAAENRPSGSLCGH